MQCDVTQESDDEISLYNWNDNFVILTKFSSEAALEVVILTTSSAATDENFTKGRHFHFSD